MSLEEAKKILGRGGISSHHLNNMVLALSLHSWNNTREEWQRLEAAKIVLRSRKKK